MTFWTKIASLAARRFDAAECEDCPPGPPGADPAFSTAVTALGAKLARADGNAGPEEFAAFSQVFQTAEASARDVRRLYDLAQQTTAGFESYARRLAKRYRGCPQILEDVLDGLFHIAKADGDVTQRELAYLEQVGDLLGVPPLTARRLKAIHVGYGVDDPYVILGATHDASDEAVRLIWKTQLAQSHPDRARARGLPAEFVEVAESKAAALNAAYDQIMRERRILGASGAER